METLENHAFTIKGFLISRDAPPAIMTSIDTIIGSFKQGGMPPIERPMSFTRPAPRLPAQPHQPEPKKIIPKDVASTLTAAGKRPKLHKLDPVADLPDIQERHNAGETNGSIAKSYDVSDQTIINFLNKNGTYDTPRGWALRAMNSKNETAARPRLREQHETVKRENALGEPLKPAVKPNAKAPMHNPMHHDVKKNSKKWKIHAKEENLTPGSLMDIHDMLSAGKTVSQIAKHFDAPEDDVVAFILANPNAQFTKCRPGFNPAPIVNRG